MFEIINSAIHLVKNIDEFFKRLKKKPIVEIAERFIFLFECHGVHRNQIPGFFGRGITLQAVCDVESLAQILTPEHLKAASDIFGIKQTWLEFVSEEVYEVPDFYKHPEQFEVFITELKQSAPQLECYVLRTQESSQYDDDSDGAFLFVEIIDEINGQPIVKYHLVGHEKIGYWKSRADFAANCGLLIKHKINEIGKYAHRDWLAKLNHGMMIPRYDFRYGETAVASSAVWYVDEFFEQPDLYLSGVNAERDDYGLKSAISRWLKWSGKGYFDCFDDNSHPECRERFIKRLEELQ